MSTIKPRYFNDAGPVREADKGNLDAESLIFTFRTGKPFDIPTDEYHTIGGELDYIPVLPGKNIVAELQYEGPIECRDFVDGFMEMSYPFSNPIFNSDFLLQESDGRYLFRTRYAEERNPSLPGLREARMSIPEYIREKYMKKREMPKDISLMLGGGDDLRVSLWMLCNTIDLISNRETREGDYYDFDGLMKEYAENESISGDCKSISTFAAGMLNALGLPARLMDGTLIGESSNHVWPEAYVSRKGEEGFWVPADPIGYNTAYPNLNEENEYAFCGVKLPSFLDQSIKTAKLRISYE